MKNKKTERIVMAIAAVFVLLCLCFVFRNNIPNSSNKKATEREMPVADDVSVELVKGVMISQEFENDIDTIENIAIVFTKFYREAHGKVTFQLLNENGIIFSQSLDASEIPEQHRVFFTPLNPLTNLSGRTLTIRIFAESEDNDGVAIMIKTEGVSDTKIRTNDSEIDGTLCFRINDKKDQ